jgi:hypothetical protein
MKKTILALIVAAFTINFSYAQTNTFPSSGNVGIGTTSPTSLFSVSGGALTVGTNSGQYTLSSIDNTSTSLFYGASMAGIFAGDFMFRSFWGVSIDLNDGLYGDSGIATYTRIPYSSSFTINSRINNTSFNTLFTVRNNGKVGIGTTTPDQLLSVNGTIHSKEVLVNTTGFPDYVFKPTYHLPTLTEVKAYIDQNHHLPSMPTEADVTKNGLKVGETEALLTKKIEELTLYLIEKDKQVAEQKSVNQHLQNEIDELRKLIIKH